MPSYIRLAKKNVGIEFCEKEIDTSTITTAGSFKLLSLVGPLFHSLSQSLKSTDALLKGKGQIIY